MRWIKPAPALTAALLIASAPAGAAPLAASDLLKGGAAPGSPVSAWRPGDPIPREAGRRAPRRPADLGNDTVATDVRVPPVGVRRLDGPDADRAGTVSAHAAGLPRDLWAGADGAAVTQAINDARPRLPATQRALRAILVAQLDPPQSGTGGSVTAAGQLFLARVDRLLALGAVDAATQLMDAAGPGDAQRQRRRFDAALLIGDEGRACEAMAARPGAAPDMAARLFCLARSGDWAAAALGLRGAEAMNLIEPGIAARLAAFLDDAGTDAGTEVPPPDPVTPLDFRLLAAIGQPLPTTELPPAFAYADLVPEGGWKARLDAAERLARLGSLAPTRLRDIYGEERPAASGGVWDRVSAMQALDAALDAQGPSAVAAALPRAIDKMGAAGLTAPLAAMVVPELLRMQLPGDAGRQALHLALYEADILGPKVFAALPEPGDPADVWLLAVARQAPLPPQGAPTEPLGAALAAALTGPAEPHPTGEAAGLALLRALADVDAGLDGDIARAEKGVRTLRALGREATARGAALQLILAPALKAQRG
ncbi:hypothetical protein DRW48_13805 [Paracoccus suum]|uniref:Antifreeze protein n=1 Tax=Paracoccus suum TaxID=2259340 RepID=A0A344PML3_9RHOB|nr:hypothetical protein [Paracoccus suum]AXC50618.1 hypothetical protein DRW48_13805 [Paracoccus suum]